MPVFKGHFTDSCGRKIQLRWDSDYWKYKLGKHPELANQIHASKLIEDALLNPDLVFKEKGLPADAERIIIYYREIKRHQHFFTVTKIVIAKYQKMKVYYLKSVFQPSGTIEFIINEKKYPRRFKEIWRNPNCSI